MKRELTEGPFFSSFFLSKLKLYKKKTTDVRFCAGALFQPRRTLTRFPCLRVSGLSLETRSHFLRAAARLGCAVMMIRPLNPSVGLTFARAPALFLKGLVRQRRCLRCGRPVVGGSAVCLAGVTPGAPRCLAWHRDSAAARRPPPPLPHHHPHHHPLHPADSQNHYMVFVM